MLAMKIHFAISYVVQNPEFGFVIISLLKTDFRKWIEGTGLQ